MPRTLPRLGGWQLQHILVLAFALTTVVTTMVGNRSWVGNHLRHRQDASGADKRGK
jgi:hypothetical protein